MNIRKRGDLMQVEVKNDGSWEEPKIVIFTAFITEEVNQLVKHLTEEDSSIILGYIDGKDEILEPDDIIRIQAQSGKVFAETSQGKYQLRFRLYELRY